MVAAHYMVDGGGEESVRVANYIFKQNGKGRRHKSDLVS